MALLIGPVSPGTHAWPLSRVLPKTQVGSQGTPAFQVQGDMENLGHQVQAENVCLSGRQAKCAGGRSWPLRAESSY